MGEEEDDFFCRSGWHAGTAQFDNPMKEEGVI